MLFLETRQLSKLSFNGFLKYSPVFQHFLDTLYSIVIQQSKSTSTQQHTWNVCLIFWLKVFTPILKRTYNTFSCIVDLVKTCFLSILSCPYYFINPLTQTLGVVHQLTCSTRQTRSSVVDDCIQAINHLTYLGTTHSSNHSTSGTYSSNTAFTYCLAGSKFNYFVFSTFKGFTNELLSRLKHFWDLIRCSLAAVVQLNLNQLSSQCSQLIVTCLSHTCVGSTSTKPINQSTPGKFKTFNKRFALVVQLQLLSSKAKCFVKGFIAQTKCNKPTHVVRRVTHTSLWHEHKLVQFIVDLAFQQTTCLLVQLAQLSISVVVRRCSIFKNVTHHSFNLFSHKQLTVTKRYVSCFDFANKHTLTSHFCLYPSIQCSRRICFNLSFNGTSHAMQIANHGVHDTTQGFIKFTAYIACIQTIKHILGTESLLRCNHWEQLTINSTVAIGVLSCFIK